MAYTQKLPSGRHRGVYRHPVTRRRMSQTFDYAYEAEAWAAEAERAARADTAEVSASVSFPTIAPAEEGPTVRTYGRNYLERRRGLLAKQTFNKYRSALDGLGKPVEGVGAIADRRMGELTKATVERWLSESKLAGVGHPTINKQLKFLRMLYLDLLDSDNPPAGVRNPTRGIDLLPESPEVYVLSESEKTRLLAAAGDQLRLPAMLALDAGLRWQEVYALRGRSIKNRGDYVEVTHAVEKDSATLKTTKTVEHRTVPTTKRLSAALAALEVGPDDLLFPTPQGNVWRASNWYRNIWKPTLKAAGMTNAEGRTDFAFHALRHTYASWLASNGVPRSEIARLLGHSSEAMAGRYIHAGDDGRRLELVRGVKSA